MREGKDQGKSPACGESARQRIGLNEKGPSTPDYDVVLEFLSLNAQVDRWKAELNL